MDDRTKEIERVTVWGAVCNLLLSLLKLVAGLSGHSAAMVADAVHSFSDLASDAVVAVFSGISAKGKDKGHDYGHGKFETLATACISIILVVVGARMLAGAVARIRLMCEGGTLERPGFFALAMAAVSIVVKEILYRWTDSVGRKVESPAVVANAWHHRTDALSSIGSLVGIGGAIALGGRWIVLDSVAGFIISIFIIVIAVRMAVPALNELTDASLPEDMEERIVSIMESVAGVGDIHDLKTRRCGHYSIVEAHIVVDPSLTVQEAHDITVEMENRLKRVFGVEMQINIHVEPSVDSL